MEHIVNTFLGLPEDKREEYFLKEVWGKAGSLKDFHHHYKKQIIYNIQKKYFYLITFTLDPSKKCTEKEAEAFIHAQAQRQALKIKQFYVSKEKHKSGKPHWHVAIETLKPLKKDRFNYYIKKFGNIDLSRSKAQTISESLNYISKDVEPSKLI